MEIAHIALSFTVLVAVILCIAVHEAAHAWAAKTQGDHTAEHEGRLTLNPASHIDMVGTILFPFFGSLISLTLGGSLFLFGWGKPVPVNERAMRHKWSGGFVAAAGPLSNLLFCIITIIAFKVYLANFSTVVAKGHVLFPVVELLQYMVMLNAVLAVFNLLPLRPLDGERVFIPLLPLSAQEFYEDYIAPHSFFILLAMMFSGMLGWIGILAHGYIAAIEMSLRMVTGL